jgi:hypothetical protein
MLNGLQIYPINSGGNNFMKSLKADQLIKGPDGTWVYSSSPDLGYGIRMSHPFNQITEAKNGLGLVSFHVEIIEVANQFIRGIPSVDLYLVETKSKLMIGAANIQTPKSSAPRPANTKECTSLFCRWKAIFSSTKASSFRKGCGSKRPHGLPRPHGIKGGPNKFPHHRPHHSSFRQGDRHPRHGVIARLFRSVFYHIIVPILIGIMVGITASLIGMFVGHVLIFFWRVFFRRGERGQYCRVKQDETSGDAEDGEDESKAFLDNQGPPPVYEAAVTVDEKAEQK